MLRALSESSDVEEDADEDTPMSSQNRPDASSEVLGEKTSTVLTETSGNRGQGDDDSEDDDMPVVKSSRRSRAMPFIVEDDDSE